jgi:hypothetical protein
MFEHVFSLLLAFALGVVTGGAIALVVFAPKRTISTPELPDEGADGGSNHVEITAGAGCRSCCNHLSAGLRRPLASPDFAGCECRPIGATAGPPPRAA